MSEPILEQLPYLRRFARALVGRQGAGDRLVAKAIASLGQGSAADDTGTLRLELLRALVDAHRAEQAAGPAKAASGLTETVVDERIVASRIRSLSDDAATALLLAALEGLTVADVAFVMRLDPAAAEARLASAQRVLDAQAPSLVLIIEDEPVIAMDIAGIVRQAGHTVLGIATTREEALVMAEGQRPDLVLADIRLADDSSGIKAVDDIRGLGPVPVIFITAYPERLLDDERVEPSLLITKPFSDHLLRVAIAQALEINARPAGRLASAAP